MTFKSPPMEKFKDVPGKIIVEIQEVKPEFRGMGFTLEKLRKLLGGDEGFVTDPYHGKDHKVSLKAWAGVDPTSTELTIFFNFQPDADYVQKHPDKFRPNTRTKKDADIIIDKSGDASTQACS